LENPGSCEPDLFFGEDDLGVVEPLEEPFSTSRILGSDSFFEIEVSGLDNLAEDPEEAPLLLLVFFNELPIFEQIEFYGITDNK